MKFGIFPSPRAYMGGSKSNISTISSNFSHISSYLPHISPYLPHIPSWGHVIDFQQVLFLAPSLEFFGRNIGADCRIFPSLKFIDDVTALCLSLSLSLSHSLCLLHHSSLFLFLPPISLSPSFSSLEQSICLCLSLFFV